MLVWTCVPSGKSGLYTTYYRYRDRCNYYTPELEPERQQTKEEKQISRFQELEISYNEENVQTIADKAYVSEQYVITPRKKPRGGELTTEEKDFNRSISSSRAAIENINKRIKKYAILGSVYRGPYDDMDKIARIVAALCNLNL
ncbi:unnamed protein product, partial [Rotaria sp. Silwood1]